MAILHSDSKTIQQSLLHDWLLENGSNSEKTLWHVMSPTMRVAADAAKHLNPQCTIWMVVLHLAMADTHAGTVN